VAKTEQPNDFLPYPRTIRRCPAVFNHDLYISRFLRPNHSSV